MKQISQEVFFLSVLIEFFIFFGISECIIEIPKTLENVNELFLMIFIILAMMNGCICLYNYKRMKEDEDEK